MVSVGSATNGGLGSMLGGSSGSNGLGKDDFLKLLVTQISNQSPLEPMDGSDFVAQLAQFSSVEQLTSVNSGLEALSMGQSVIIQGQSLEMIGKTVTYEGNKVDLGSEGNAGFKYSLSARATDASVTIKDAAGRTVRTLPLASLGVGTHRGAWDGTDGSGNRLPAGTYTISVEATFEGDGGSARTFSTRRVTGINFDKGLPELIIGDERVQPNQVTEIAD